MHAGLSLPSPVATHAGPSVSPVSLLLSPSSVPPVLVSAGGSLVEVVVLVLAPDSQILVSRLHVSPRSQPFPPVQLQPSEPI